MSDSSEPRAKPAERPARSGLKEPDIHRMSGGFPIRRSPDQRLFATPRSLSQRTTSFIASYRLGIHQTPFSRLIRDSESDGAPRVRCASRELPLGRHCPKHQCRADSMFAKQTCESPHRRFPLPRPSIPGAFAHRSDSARVSGEGFRTLASKCAVAEPPRPLRLATGRFGEAKAPWSVHLDLERLCSCSQDPRQPGDRKSPFGSNGSCRDLPHSGDP